MCPNQEVDRSLLPDSRIADRVYMYCMLDYLHSEGRRSEEVDDHLRERYEIFCQVLHNFPIPLHNLHMALSEDLEVENDFESLFDALQQQQQQLRAQLQQPQQQSVNTTALGSVGLGSSSSNSTLSSNFSEICEYYEDAVCTALAQLGGHSGATNDLARNEEGSNNN